MLPNSARRSPDASWTLKSRIDQLGTAKLQSFWHLCPDFVIEVKSESDRLNPVRSKMREYLEQGAQLGWLISPQTKGVEIHRPGTEAITLSGIDPVDGEGPGTGFVLDLKYVWDPLAD